MYDLGDQFKFDMDKAIANQECVFRGIRYRITVLTERLVRLEYSQKGLFENHPSELVWYRNFKKPEFTVNETNKILNIKTKYFELNYVKDKKFRGGIFGFNKNLQITLAGSEKPWYYKHPEVRNYDASVFGFNDTKNKTLKKSLYSLDGFACIDDSKSKVMLENGTYAKRENSKNLDLYVFFYGNDFYYCLNDYFMITGYPPLIPRYALGNWWCKEDFYNEFDVAHLIKKFEDNNIPIALFQLSKWRKDDYFMFSDAFKEPKSIINYAHTKNIKFGLLLDKPDYFKRYTKSYNVLNDYLAKDKEGNIPFDSFDTRTIDAVLKLLIHPLDSLGIDFYSLDTFDEKKLDSLSAFKHYLYYDKVNLDGKRPLISSYNFHNASHRYSTLYAGKSQVSWDTLKKIPSFNARATNMGLSFFSNDTGGSTGGIEDNELFIRFVELATFSPILRLGSDGGKYYKREIWKWSLKTREISTRFLNLRHSLIPYTYTESYKYHKYGKPLIEPLYYRYPDLYDNVLYKDEYLFGSTFLISPITTKKNYLMNRVIQKIYIPDGMWYDFFTGKQYKGNKKYTAFYRDQEYPVFVKAGAIIPMALNKLNDTSVPTNMEIQVFPGANNTYSIYEDDGETNKYMNGDYLITNVEFVYEKNDYRLTILPVAGKKSIIPAKRNYKIRFKNTKPTSVISSFIGSERARNNSYKDGTDLIVEISDVPTSAQLTIIVKGKDIEIEAIRIINDDVVSIISDLPIKTAVKQKIDDIMFLSDLPLKKKRIEIRKLAHGKNYIERKYIDLLLKLLEYINEV